jgi:transcriptional repressor NrdR
LRAVRCPACASLDDKVVDSRTTDDGTAVRRRRQCLACATRFTTFERLEETPLVVVKSSGEEVPFDRAKIVAGVELAAKGRPVSSATIDEMATGVEDQVRLEGSVVTSERIGRAVLEALARLDGVAALRFASVYKGFDDLADFEREIGLLTKITPS